jgi:hypothetical protein
MLGLTEPYLLVILVMLPHLEALLQNLFLHLLTLVPFSQTLLLILMFTIMTQNKVIREML